MAIMSTNSTCASLPRLFLLFHAVIGRTSFYPVALLESATANGYKQGAY